MKRGIIFSMDASLALIAVVVLAASLPIQFNAMEEKGSAYESLHEQAMDKAIAGFYLDQPGETPNFSGKEFGKCTVVYTLLEDPTSNNLNGPDIPLEKVFCEAK